MLVVLAVVFSIDVKYSSEATLVIAVQGQQTSAISHPGHTAAQRCGDNYSTVDKKRDLSLEIVVIEHLWN